MFMKAYLENLSMRTWLMIVLPALAVAYPIARLVFPAIVHAVVPDVVRTVLHVM